MVGLIIAGLFAAAMGALSSALNATAAIIVTDFSSFFSPATDDAQRTRQARWTTLLAGGLATVMAALIASLRVAP